MPFFILLWYNCPWHIVVNLFSSMRLSWSCRVWTYSTSSNWASINTLREAISTSKWRTASIPYTNENGVALVDVRTGVRYPCNVNKSISCQYLCHFHLLDNFLYIFICYFDCSIHFLVIRIIFMMLNLEFVAELGHHFVVQVCGIVGNNSTRQPISID